MNKRRERDRVRKTDIERETERQFNITIYNETDTRNLFRN